MLPEAVTTIADGNFLTFENGVTLFGKSGSVAEQYALSHPAQISFVAIDDELVYSGIEVVEGTYDKEFVEGTEISFGGLVVVAKCALGTVQIDDYELSYQADTIGTHTVTVTYKGHKTEFEIRVVEKSPSWVEITTLPTKTEYIEGLPLDLTGMVVTIHYNNGTSEVRTDYTCTGYEKDFIGRQTIRVHYAGLFDTFEVTVVEKQLIGIEVVTLPNKITYEIGEDLDLTGLVVKLAYDNGTYDDAVIEYNVGGYDKTVLGEQTVTVTYGDYTDTFTVTVIKHTAAVADAPTMQSKTDTSVMLNEQVGCEYSINGVNWQASTLFEGLDPHTAYTFYARYAETDDTYAGASGTGLNVTTCFTLTGYVKVNGVLVEGNTLSANIGNITPVGKTVSYQWYKNGVAIDGETTAEYVVKASDVEAFITVVVSGTGEYFGALSGYAQAPLPKVVSTTGTSIAVEEIAGNEYSLDGQNWQTTAVFANLTSNTRYSIYQRVAATATTVAGDTSVALVVTTPEVFTVTWVVDGVETTESYDYGTTPSFKGSTDKAATAQYTYTFAGWDKSIATVTGDVTYTAQYSSTVNKYTVTWNVNGTETTESYDYGTTPSFKGSTDKAATAQYTYTFAGWDKTIATVTGDVTYTAQYSSTVNKYTVTWNVDGVETTESYDYGATPSFKGSTDKAATAQYTYTFTGWDKEIVTVTGNVTYTAQYSSTVNKYTVTWNVEGVETTESYDYGATPSFKGSTDKAAEPHYTYTFDGWDNDIVAVTGNTTYVAQYIRNTVHDYSVTAYDDVEHWIVCSICGEEKPESHEAHTGGTATCTEQKDCEHCGTSYGTALGHDFTVDQHDATHHWTRCSRCDEIDGKREHDYADDHVCDTCGYEDESRKGLSTGAIVGIATGGTVVVGGGGFALVWFAIKKKSWADLIAVFAKK